MWRALTAGLLLLACRSTPLPETGFLNRTLTHAGKTYRYVVYVPATRSGKFPVLLFLHGSGERGDDGLKQSDVGLGRAIRMNAGRFPLIAVFPQAPSDTRWLGDEGRFAMLAAERAAAEFDGDLDRLYLTGMSMGGYGTWHLALENPGRFAALVPICGGIRESPRVTSVRQSPLTMSAADPYAFVAEALRNTPAWIFHGEDDGLIPASESRKMFEELKARGADVRYTEFPKVGHNSWDPAYETKELWTWMLTKRRSR